ncbi:MAG TPA: iron ABC transporter permease [Vicinamibacteria bacterium]|jgi:iron complex transport system permease protein|nr:iron ABC transporter permease [Vicinamibacteria bacterium]
MTEGGRRRAAFAVLAALLPLTVMVAVAFGSVRLPLLSTLGSLGLPIGGRLSPPAEAILWSVRVPRVLLAAVVGGGLAVVGAALQSVFRNPMADAGLLGVGPGAAFGAVLAVRSGVSETFLGLPASAFAGAVAASLAVYVLARATGRATLSGLLLTGLAVSALAAAGTSILLVATEEFRVKAVLFWLAGGLEGRGWPHLRLAAAAVAAGGLALLALSRPLDVLALGEEEAASLGLRVHLTRVAILAVASLIAGAATAASGSVPFVGLIAPHALRPAVGPLARHLLPAAFLAGAALVVAADLAARTLSDRLDLPLGSLTAFIGAPYFLFALKALDEQRS